MIEEVILNYLQSQLGVPVVMQYPLVEPDAFVLLEKVGGSKQGMIRTASFALQSYASSMYEAAKLNENVIAAMDQAVVLAEVSRADLDSDYEYTDEKMKKYRYQAIYDLVLF